MAEVKPSGSVSTAISSSRPGARYAIRFMSRACIRHQCKPDQRLARVGLYIQIHRDGREVAFSLSPANSSVFRQHLEIYRKRPKTPQAVRARRRLQPFRNDSDISCGSRRVACAHFGPTPFDQQDRRRQPSTLHDTTAARWLTYGRTSPGGRCCDGSRGSGCVSRLRENGGSCFETQPAYPPWEKRPRRAAVAKGPRCVRWLLARRTGQRKPTSRRTAAHIDH